MILICKLVGAILIALKLAGIADIDWGLALAPVIAFVALKIVESVALGIIDALLDADTAKHHGNKEKGE